MRSVAAQPSPYQEVMNMQRLNHAKTLIKPLLTAAGMATVFAASAGAGDAGKGAAVDPESVARAGWRAVMAHNSTPAAGCFHASYPNLVWENVACSKAQPRVHPLHAQPKNGAPESTGGTATANNDYAAWATGLITEAFGFFETSGVKSEVGVSIFGGGILGPNEYSIQLNTNEWETTSACDGGQSGCRVWQQFIYATDYIGEGEAAVFMQYWLLDWGYSQCPLGFFQDYQNCYANSFLMPAPDVPITDLGNVVLAGSAAAGGNDTVAFTFESEAYSITFPDAVLNISTVWNKAEFNVVGNAGGARADFNAGSSITVNLDLADGSTAAPTCLANGGSTGESNNLNAGACTTAGGIPHIQFIESLRDLTK
jgi:hypothetical protein